jgi:GT2 family glycosyltransferase
MANGYSMINLPVNLGLAGAFQVGIMYALRNQYDSVMQFDADGQHNACHIEQMIYKLESSGCDVVIGSRYIKGIRQEIFV